MCQDGRRAALTTPADESQRQDRAATSFNNDVASYYNQFNQARYSWLTIKVSASRK